MRVQPGDSEVDHSWTIKNARRIYPAGVSHCGKNTSRNLLNLQIRECIKSNFLGPIEIEPL